MLYKDIVDAMTNVLSRFEGVNCVRYQSDELNNAQHNYKTLQVYIDDVSLHQFNVTQNRAKAEFNIFILGFPKDKNDKDGILTIQDECYNVAVNFLGIIDIMPEYQGILSVYDYSILTLSHFTAQDNAGVKLTLVLEIPNGMNLCENTLNDEPYEEEKDLDIEIDTKEQNEFELKKIKLPINPVC